MKHPYLPFLFPLCLLLVPMVLAETNDIILSGSGNITDTFIYKNSPDSNYEGGETMLVYQYSNPARAIFRIDLSSLNIDSINTANITLIHFDTIVVPTSSYCFYELEEEFISSEATWNDKSSGVNWNIAGGQYNTTNGSCITEAWHASGTPHTWILTDLIKRLVDDEGKSVIWLLLRSPESSQAYGVYYSSTEAGSGKPGLGLNYEASISSFNLTTIFHTGIDQVLVNGTSKTNGTVTSINASQLANITSLADSGYIFLNYNGSITDNPYMLNMTQDYTVHVYAATYALTLTSDQSSVFTSQLITLSAYHLYEGSGLSGTLITFQVSSDNISWSNILNQTTISTGYSNINYAQGESGTWYFRLHFPGDGTYEEINSPSIEIEFRQISNNHIIYPSNGLPSIEDETIPPSYDYTNNAIIIGLSISIIIIIIILSVRIKSFRG